MRIGGYELKLEKRVAISGWKAAGISILAIFVALALFSVIFIQAGDQSLRGLPGDLYIRFCHPFRSAADHKSLYIPVVLHLRVYHPFSSRAMEYRHGRAIIRRGIGVPTGCYTLSASKA